MKAKKTYLKGRSVFIVSIFVIVVSILTVYLTGVNYNRSLTTNLYWSLSIISTVLFLFIASGLYLGVGLIDNFPKFRNFKAGDYLANSGTTPDLPDFEAGEGFAGLILSILWWMLITLLFVILMVVLEVIFWFSLFILLAMLYWVFFKALKFVFSKSSNTKNKFATSVIYALTYTALYTSWIFGVVYLAERIK